MSSKKQQQKHVCEVDKAGNKYWYRNGKYHRVNGPTIEYANGGKCWYLNDKRHRVNGPAIEYANGDKHWYLNGKHHRVNGPAIEYANGGKCWYLNDKFYFSTAQTEFEQVVGLVSFLEAVAKLAK